MVPYAEHTKNLFNPANRSIIRSLRIRATQRIYKNSFHKSYISIDTYKNLADYFVFGSSGREKIDLDKAFRSKVIFVDSDKFEDIDFNFFPNLKVVISGNTDRNFLELPKVPASIKLMLLQNCCISNEKIKTLPIGIENKKNGRYFASQVFRNPINRNKFGSKILVPPMSDTNPIRSDSIKVALSLPDFFDVKVNYLHEKQYFDLIKKYNFTLCLEGNGFENHRIWESLYLGIFPVMLRTSWSESLGYLNLPILLIDDLKQITREKLNSFWALNSDFNPKKAPALNTGYWINLINQATSING